jgi:hypothetical protein
MPEDPTQPRYPDIQVQLTGQDGNAFAILGRTAGALRQAGLPQEEIDDYFAEATSGDYDHLLQTTMRWVHWE